MVDFPHSTDSTEYRILNAAIKIFTQRGLDGTRMQDIADEARVTKQWCITITVVKTSFFN